MPFFVLWTMLKIISEVHMRRFTTVQITEPSVEPVTLAEVKTYLRIDTNEDDNLITMLLKSARKLLEAELGMKFISQQWDFYTDEWGLCKKAPWWDGVRDGAVSELYSKEAIELPFGRIISLDAFNTYADDDVAVDAGVSNYSVDKFAKQGRIALKNGQTWPTTVLRPVAGIQIRCTLGFGTAASDVPADIKQAIMEIVSHSYENRGDQDKMTIPDHVFQLVGSWGSVQIG